MLSGQLDRNKIRRKTIDDEGVSCSVCHSITEARLDGTGSYTIRRPALLVKSNGTPVHGDVPDSEIMASVADHKRAMMSDVIKSPEFCATCHKAAAPHELNNYKSMRGFNAYDEWQMSGASTDTITPYYRSDKRLDCRSCHMPAAGEGMKDVSAKNGTVASHRFLGANTATPLFYGQHAQVKKTTEFLQNGVITADIFAVRNEATNELFSSLHQDAESSISWQPNQEITADVVVFNRKAAHSFPPELRDMYEPWVEFEALNEKGDTIYHSGYVRPDKTLDEKAHVYKAILLDSFARVVTRHQVWSTAIKAYDNFIPPGRSDLVRYKFTLPEGVNAVTLRAKVNYRRFIQEYTDYVLSRNKAAHLEMPIVKMAETTVRLVNQQEAKPKTASGEQEAKRWNDYGIGLLDQREDSQAAMAFRKAAELHPAKADYLVSAAIAEMRMERFAFDDLAQLKKTEVLISQALKTSPGFPRARFYQAAILRAFGKMAEAAKIFGDLAKAHPQDREVRRQLGQTLYSLGRIREAMTEFEAVIKIDPTDALAWQFLEPIYINQGRLSDAATAGRNYLLWRDDPIAESVASLFYQNNPSWADARIRPKAYSHNSPSRPTATGVQAVPSE